MLKERRLTNIGNSIGLTIPHEILKEINLKNGDDVYIELKGSEIIIKKKLTKLPFGISEDFYSILESTMKQYDETIKALREK